MKRKIALLLACALVVSSLVACGTAVEDTATTKEISKTDESLGTAENSEKIETSETQGTHTVHDYAGIDVEVPNDVQRVVIDVLPILSTYMAYFEGSAPHIVGMAGAFKETISETVLKDIAPELLETADTVYAQGDFNIEEIMKLNPDVIIYPAGIGEEHEQVLQNSGVPCVAFPIIYDPDTPADPILRYQQWLKQLEEIFGEQGKMDAFIAAGNKIVEDVEDRIAKIPAENRPTAIQIQSYSDGNLSVAGSGTFGQYWFEHLGVQNVATEVKLFGQISVEQLYEWDPDVIYVAGPGLCKVRTEDVLNNNVEGIDFSAMQAPKNGRVYNTLLGMWGWTTPNPDAPLVLAWMACRMYPEEFADYPLEETIREYYKTWYGYDVSDAEMATMLEY